MFYLNQLLPLVVGIMHADDLTLQMLHFRHNFVGSDFLIFRTISVEPLGPLLQISYGGVKLRKAQVLVALLGVQIHLIAGC